MIELRLFGTIGLEGGRDAASLLARPRDLAVLAYLAAADATGYQRRDTLCALFWPESDELHARNSLNQSLHRLRRALDDRVCVTHGTHEVGLDPAVCRSDVGRFESALRAAQTREAVELYRDDFLAGFFISGAPQFERWLEEARRRFRSRAQEASRALRESALRAGDMKEAVRWARRAVELSQNEEEEVRRLVEILNQSGDRVAAVREYERFEQWARQELEVEPSARTQATVAAIRAGDMLALAGSSGGHPLLGAAASHLQADLARRAVATAGVAGLAAVAVLAVIYLVTLGLGLPDWVTPAAAALLAAGLPITVVTGVLEGMRAGAPPRHSRWSPVTSLLTWRKVMVGGAAAFLSLGAGTGAYMAMRAYGVGPPGTLLASGRLMRGDRLIVAEFENGTEDPLLAGAVAGALRIDLAQSRAIRVLDPADVGQAAERMGLERTAPLNAELARRVAVREGAKAIVAGEVTAAGVGYVLSARILATASGEALVAVRETASDSTQVIPAIDRLSARLRERVGESLKAIRSSPPLERVTTPSLAALRLYTEAVRVGWLQGSDQERAVALLEQAVSGDTGFATAHRVLAVALGNLGVSQARRVDLVTTAYTLRDRLPELERYLAEGSYWRVMGERDKETVAWEQVLELNPEDFRALHYLGLNFEAQRDFRPAEAMFRRAYQATPAARVLSSVVDVQLEQGKLEAARATVAELRRAFPGDPFGPANAAAVAYASDERAAALGHWRAVDAAAPSPFWKGLAGFGGAGVLAVQGNLNQIESRYERGAAIYADARRARDYLANAAWRAVLDGRLARDPTRGLRRLEGALARFPLDSIDALERPYLDVAYAQAILGQPEVAHALLAELDRVRHWPTIPGSTAMRANRLLVAGLIALAEGRGHDALGELRHAVMESVWSPAALPLLGQSYELIGERDSAIAAYERYLATPFTVGGLVRACCSVLRDQLASDAVWRAWIYRRLGELHAERGQRDRAAFYYKRFVELWKDSDPELQLQVGEVRRHLVRLNLAGRQ